MHKKQYSLLLVLMVFAGFLGRAMSARVFASQAAPPTIALITPGRLLEDGVASDKIVPILTPLGVYQQGQWISGYRYDVPGTKRYLKADPTPEAKGRLWKDLQSQTFFGLHDETLVFTPTRLIEHCTPYGNVHLGLRGILSSDALLDTEKAEVVLVLNRKVAVQRPSPAERLAGQDNMAEFVKEALGPHEAALVGKRWSHGFNPKLAQPPTLEQALRLDLGKDLKATFVHFVRHYVEPNPKEDDSRDEYYDFWKGHYYGVFETGPSGTCEPLWQYARIHNDQRDDRIYYVPLATIDVSGDGVAEVVFEEEYWEGRGYSLYQLKKGTLVKVAKAGIDVP